MPGHTAHPPTHLLGDEGDGLTGAARPPPYAWDDTGVPGLLLLLPGAVTCAWERALEVAEVALEAGAAVLDAAGRGAGWMPARRAISPCAADSTLAMLLLVPRGCRAE